MNYFLKVNKNLLTYFIIIFLLVPIFGINFFIGLLGNILILLFLIPILLLLVVFIGLNYYKSRLRTCGNCGAISLGLNNTCMSCGSELGDVSIDSEIYKKASDSTIEVKAEEIK